jgi:polyisoprenyl-teichoic acid--peptidoglycan teichoic acid transferase
VKNLNLSKKRHKKLTKLMPGITVIAVVLLVLFLLSLMRGSGESFRFIFQDSLRSTDDRVNVLLLGNAGGRHEGADLTDTVIVASINLKTNHVYLISLPRDLWVESVKGKLNSVYEIGEKKGDGLGYSKEAIGEILGLPIHYGVRIDFGGFIKAVDLLGGLDVDVARTFDDYLYPIEGRENDLCGLEEKEIEFNEEEAKKLNIEIGKRKVLVLKDGKIATDSADPEKGEEYFTCRYEHIHFNKGITHMDGETALKFVRSRHGLPLSEGSDFARSRRQQLVLEAFRSKVLSHETLSSPTKISELIKTFGDSVEVDIPAADILKFYRLSKKVEQTHSTVLATSKEPLLINPSPSDYGGAWVLVPRGGSYDMIHDFVQKVLNGEVTDEASASARTSN